MICAAKARVLYGRVGSSPTLATFSPVNRFTTTLSHQHRPTANRGGGAMEASQDRQQLRERFVIALAEAAMPLKAGPDPELALEVLIEAADLFRQHLESELAEL